MLPVESLYMCRTLSCVRCGRSLVVAPCEVWGKCLFLHWQWRGNLCVASHEGWGISDCLQWSGYLCVAIFDE